jgi:hypothetical protein
MSNVSGCYRITLLRTTPTVWFCTSLCLLIAFQIGDLNTKAGTPPHFSAHSGAEQH